MENFWQQLTSINNAIKDFVWVKIGLVLLIGTGILLTCATKAFQITHIGHWFGQTIGSLFKKNSASTRKGDQKSISQFQALCTALAATIGTGNIAGVSAAIVIGGPGAVFWMWVAAFFGMMTNFSENVLGIYFRRRNAGGEWSGGAMYYLKDGLGRRRHCARPAAVLATLFAVFAILASFGIGNMGQINKITLNLQSAFFKNVDWGTVLGVPVVSFIIGIVLMMLAALIIIGGLQRIAAVAEKIVPFMAVCYMLGALWVFFIHIDQVGAVFSSIF
nr:alanine:cation symporter family protein [bacterium]